MLSRVALLSLRRSARPCLARNSSHFTQEDIEKIPVQFRDMSYNDVPFPRGSWQARYEELQKRNNVLLAFSTTLLAASIYGYYATHEYISCPDEPAERWYPLDRFKDGDGSPVV